jgi:Tissue inhibitor of metalloproteinase
MINLKILSVVILLTLQSNFNTLFACSCSTPSIEKDIKLSDVVIVAKVISNEHIYVENKDLKKGKFKTSLSKTIVEVEQKFKGKNKKSTVTFYSGNGRGNCGFQFEVGERYIIFGYKKGRLLSLYDFGLPKNKSLYWTDTCTRTRKYDIEEYENIVKAYKK